MTKESSGESIIKAKDAVALKVNDIKVEDLIRQALKLPAIRVDRKKFLHKELIKYYPEDTVKLAIEKIQLMQESPESE